MGSALSVRGTEMRARYSQYLLRNEETERMKRVVSLLAVLALVLAFTMPVEMAQAMSHSKMENPCNPCAAKHMNPCNPCSAKKKY